MSAWGGLWGASGGGRELVASPEAFLCGAVRASAR